LHVSYDMILHGIIHYSLFVSSDSMREKLHPELFRALALWSVASSSSATIITSASSALSTSVLSTHVVRLLYTHAFREEFFHNQPFHCQC
jgi:hypothetical protein